VAKAKKKVPDAKKGDPDGIHDLRVGIRKVRGALAILCESVLDESAVEKRASELDDLFDLLGEARDDDVLVEHVKELARELDLDAESIDELVKRVERDRRKAKKRLAKAMRRRSAKRILDALARAAFDEGAARDVRKNQDEAPPTLVRHVAPGVLVDRFDRVLAYEVAVPAPLPVLHRLRIAIKKLRYAMDFFAEVLPEEGSRIEEILQRAQDQLGELHDHQVAREIVDRFRRKRGGGALRELREAEDANAARILAAFQETWGEIVSEPFRRDFFAAAMLAPAPEGTNEAVALRRAERAA
jgi:CHAD domain-containing protein